MVKREVKSQSLINLSLGFDQRVEKVECRDSTVGMFTEDQIKELEVQLIVFKYIVWGWPIPNNLLLWLGISSRRTYHQILMDLEPGRCRRNSGKNWRCHQPVFPNENYCQKHRYQGRNCSRKLVEAATIYPPKVNEHLCKNTESALSFVVPSPQNRNSWPLNELNEVVIKAPTLTDIVAKRGEKVKTYLMDLEPGRCNRNDGHRWRCYQPVFPNKKYCQKHMDRRRNRSGKLVAKRDIKVEKSSGGKHDMIDKERIADINLSFALNYSTEGVHQDDHRCSEAERQVRPPQPVPQRCSRSDGRKWQHNDRGLLNPSISPSSPKWDYCKQVKTGVGLGRGIDLNISLFTELDDPRPNIRDSSTVKGYSWSSDASTKTTISDARFMKIDKREVKPQPMLNLSLGIGNVYQKDRYDVKVEVDDHDHHFDQRVERVGFTDEQIKELELQVDVCNYIVWGLPVPNKLLHVWRSLSPSFTLTSCPLWLDISDRGTYHQNLTNLMPVRCSRTDGKKWRCCQHVIPNKKYCQKHMWRGKKRSRKLVEGVSTSHSLIGQFYQEFPHPHTYHRYSEAERQVDPPQPVPKRCSRTEGRKRQRINRGLNNPSISPSTPKLAYCKHAKTGMGLGLGIDLNISLSTPLEDPSPNIRYSSTGNSCNTSSVCTDYY